MSSSVGFLDFFILEAGEYVEQLDGLIARAGAAGPDGEAMQRAARSLRGSATMAKLPAFADLAQALERLGRARREGSIEWDARVRGAAVSAVDELKILLRAARSWGESETTRARTRTDELLALVPASRGATPSPAATSGLAFLAGEMSNIAAGLELVLTRPDDATGTAMVLRRVRALRGVAAIKDLPPVVAQVLEAAEQAAQPLEEGPRTLATAQRELLETASRLLRGIGDALRTGGEVRPSDADARRFGDALDAWLDSAADGERIVPISSLFHDDAGPHVVSASGSPPTSASARFRLELVSQGEHLERLAQEARTAHDDAASERFRRELRRALRGVRGLAESFEEREVVALSGDFLNAGIFDAATLDRLSRMAALLADPALDREALDARLRQLSQPEAPEVRPTPAAAPTVPAPAPVPTPAASAPAVPTPTLLERGLAGLALLEAEPLGAPAPMAEQPPVVPIETLLYRGRAAVRRAIELRDEMRRGGGAPTPEVVEELFDLMELALLDEAVA